MNDPKVPMYYRTDIAKFLMNNNHEPRPVEINLKVIIEGLDPALVAPVSVTVDPVPKIPLLN
jgi:hypothetical protein